MAAFPILGLALFLPAVAAILVYLFARRDETARLAALIASLVPLAVSVYLLIGFLRPDLIPLALDPIQGRYRAFEEASWIPQINVFYRLAVDELSFSLVLLTTILVPLSMIYSWDQKKRVPEFFALLLLMETTMLGVFMSLDFFLFFVFWELQLVPMYFLIAVWGGSRRRYASIKFFLFTQAASLLVLLGIFVFYFYMGTGVDAFNMIAIIETGPIPIGVVQDLLFVALLIGFGTKLPMVPLHTWLPDAHVEAPTAGSVLLAGVLLKMGAYGLIRVNVQMIPEASTSLFWVFAVIGTISILYGAIVSLAQDDLKRLVANSSISHMGIVMLGIGASMYAFNNGSPGVMGISGAIFQMFAHGLISAALFMLAGSVLHRLGTRNLSELGGIMNRMPLLSWLLILAFLASLGLPGLVGFVAEFTVFLGTYEAFGLWVLLPILTVVLTAAYYLWAVQRAVHGPFRESLGEPRDIALYEILPLVVLAGLFALFGIFPAPLMDLFNAWTTNFFQAFGGI
ncbi:MAG: NADH-quinone oxidoreductase subunit M [Candidatus Thermoplasmatota archaeon]|nr:NADH-quinone oxidoreductase subunit M [Candidatus Thermoplasmatota archaeon]